MPSLRARRGRVAFVACLAALSAAGDASGATAPSFSCTATAVTAQVAGGSVVNPITAGGDGKACQPAIAGLPNVGEAVSLQDLITARTAYAAVDPGGARPSASKPTAAAGVEGLDVKLGAPVLGVGAARSSITASCANGVATLTPTSEVASISLGGTPIVLDGVVQPITDALTDALGALVEVRLNEVVDLPGGGKAVRAAHVTLVRGETPLADVVVAESRLDLNGAACDPNADGDPPAVVPPVCPNGSVYDVAHNVCVIAVPGSQTPGNPGGILTGPGSVIVGPPSSGPGGGTVITLTEARKRFPKSPCVRGAGPAYVLIGTKGRDRLTGTNRRDRVLALGGTDRVDGGRGADCVSGGNGTDFVTGGQGRDRMYGGNGRDIVNGDGKSDRLHGGRGNDTLNAAFGRDRVYGGRGNDKINVATAGQRATVFAGKGRDKVRCNPRELTRIHGAEIIKVTRPFKG